MTSTKFVTPIVFPDNTEQDTASSGGSSSEHGSVVFARDFNGGVRNSTTIQAAIDFVKLATSGNAAGGGTVIVDDGIWSITATVYLPSRIRLIGVAPAIDPGSATGTFFGGTLLRAATNMNAPIIRTEGTAAGGVEGLASQWWHVGEIAYLGIDGNKTNQSGSADVCMGIHAGHMGEAASIHHIYIQQCKGDGLVIDGESTPSYVSYVSAFWNRYGFHLRNANRLVTLINPSGDNNVELIRLSGVATTSQLSSVVIINPKAERHNGGTAAEHNPVIHINNWGGTLTIVGGSLDGSTIASGSAIKRTGPTIGPLSFLNVKMGYYTTQFEDLAAPNLSVALGSITHVLNLSTAPTISSNVGMVPTATALDPTNGSTIDFGQANVARLIPTVNRTGLIMPLGNFNGEQREVQNEAYGASITFANEAGGGRVARDGTTLTIPGRTRKRFTWHSGWFAWFTD